MSEQEQPRQGQVIKEIMVWDFDKREWVKGYIRDRARLPDVVELFWDSVAQNTTDKAPQEDKIVDVEKATEIAIQADTTPPDNTSTSVDINVEATLDGSTWDSVPYAEMNLGDNEIKTMLVNPGPKRIRLRLDENNTGVAECRVKVKVRE